MTSEFWRIVVLALVGLWLILIASRIIGYILLHRAYARGDANRVGHLMWSADANSRIALSVAFGRYAEALRAAQEHDDRTLDPGCNPPLETWLHRINACEGLVEVGRASEAIELLKWEPAMTSSFSKRGGR